MIGMTPKTIFDASFLELITLTDLYTKISFIILENMVLFISCNLTEDANNSSKLTQDKLYFIPIFTTADKYTQGGFRNINSSEKCPKF